MSGPLVMAVRVTPRSGRDAIEGADERGALKVRLTAAPADGAANSALIKLLAKVLGVPKGAVTIVSGAASRHKQLRIEGLDANAVQACWPGVSLRS